MVSHAHQFEDFDQQTEASRLGMWIFLVTELMLFGALFAGYSLYRLGHPAAFVEGSAHLDIVLGSVNTAVLILSSLTMALAVQAAELAARGESPAAFDGRCIPPGSVAPPSNTPGILGRRALQWPVATLIQRRLGATLDLHHGPLDERRRLIRWLAATMLLGAAFLVIKAFEYGHKFEEGLVPGPRFAHDLFEAANVSLFFGFYFVMTGLHALHMVVGIALLAGLSLRAWWRGQGALNPNPVEMTGLYWHFVDIVWIFLFPMLYLLGRHA